MLDATDLLFAPKLYAAMVIASQSGRSMAPILEDVIVSLQTRDYWCHVSGIHWHRVLGIPALMELEH